MIAHKQSVDRSLGMLGPEMQDAMLGGEKKMGVVYDTTRRFDTDPFGHPTYTHVAIIITRAGFVLFCSPIDRLSGTHTTTYV